MNIEKVEEVVETEMEIQEILSETDR